MEKVKVTAIRGKLYFSDNQPPTSSIVSLYYIGKKESKFINSILVGSDGYFDFKKLKNGNYYLKTGTIDGGFNCVNIKILLAPDDKDSLVEDLEIPMEVGT